MTDKPQRLVGTSVPGEKDDAQQLGVESDRTLLIVDDDHTFLTRLCRSMETRGFTVTGVRSVEEGLAIVSEQAPAFAVIDMRLADGNGLDVIRELKATRPDARGVTL